MLLEQEAGDDVREQQADHGQGQQHWLPVVVAAVVMVVATVVTVVAPRQVAAAVAKAVPVVEQGQVE